MTDEKLKTLTPSEAGAFVSQWAERHPIDVVELAQRLNVEPNQIQSLLRQAQGRLAMERWVHGQPSVKPSKKGMVAPILIAMAIGGLVVFATQKLVGGHANSPIETQQQNLMPPVGMSKSLNSPLMIAHPRPMAFLPKFHAMNLGSMTGVPRPGMGPFHPTIPKTKSVALSAPSIGGQSVPSNPPSDVVKVDLTKKLAIPVPANMTLEILTNKFRYVRQGPSKRGSVESLKLTEKDIVAPLHEMLQFVTNKELALAHNSVKNGNPGTLVLMVDIGRAHVRSQISLDEGNRANLIKVAASEKEPFYGMLVAPILQKIHMYGARLLQEPETGAG